jgi:hypothetical protein
LSFGLGVLFYHEVHEGKKGLKTEWVFCWVLLATFVAAVLLLKVILPQRKTREKELKEKNKREKNKTTKRRKPLLAESFLSRAGSPRFIL